MKKKILAVTLVLTLCFGMTGCGAYVKDGDSNFSNVDNKYIKMHEIYDKNDGSVVAYDENTKVMYLCVYGNNSMAITPIYNSDGTVKLYDGK